MNIDLVYERWRRQMVGNISLRLAGLAQMSKGHSEERIPGTR